MTALYSIQLSRSVPGSCKASVKAVPAALVGDLDKETMTLVKPDPAAVRDALPFQYRRAFDRAGRGFWFYKDGRGVASLALYSTRGKYLNTIYATLYYFKP